MNTHTGDSAPIHRWTIPQRHLLAAAGPGAGGALLAADASRLPAAAATAVAPAAGAVQLFTDPR